MLPQSVHLKLLLIDELLHRFLVRNVVLRGFVRIVLWATAALLIAIFVAAVRGLFYEPVLRVQDISFSELLSEINQGNVRHVLIKGVEIHGAFTDGRPFASYMPTDPTLIQRLCDNTKSIEITGNCQAAK